MTNIDEPPDSSNFIKVNYNDIYFKDILPDALEALKLKSEGKELNGHAKILEILAGRLNALADHITENRNIITRNSLGTRLAHMIGNYNKGEAYNPTEIRRSTRIYSAELCLGEGLSPDRAAKLREHLMYLTK